MSGVNLDQIRGAASKAVKENLRNTGWPVYERYEIRVEGGEEFVVAPVSRDSFCEREPSEDSLSWDGEGKVWRLQRHRGRDPVRGDSMTFYAPLRTPELVLELAGLAERKITSAVVKRWAEVYGLLGFPGDDVIEFYDGFMNYRVEGWGRRESVQMFAEAAGEVRACLRIYEAITADEDVDVGGLTFVANLLPRKVFEPFGPMERHVGKERPWLFSVLGELVQMRLNEYCYPRFTTYAHNNLATGRFALSWGFKGQIGAIWLHVAWLLGAEGESVKRCKLPGCLRVIRFESGEPPTDPGLKRNVRGTYRTRSDREFCKDRGCKQKYNYRKKRGWLGYY